MVLARPHKEWERETARAVDRAHDAVDARGEVLSREEAQEVAHVHLDVACPHAVESLHAQPLAVHLQLQPRRRRAER